MTRGRVRARPRSASQNLRGIRVSVCRYPGTADQSFSSPESGGTVPGPSGMSMGRGELARSWSSTAALICCSSGAAVALSVRAPAPAALWRSSLCSVVFPLPTPPLMKTRRPAPAALASKLFHKKGDALSGSRSRLRPSKGLMYTYPRTCMERRVTFLYCPVTFITPGTVPDRLSLWCFSRELIRKGCERARARGVTHRGIGAPRCFPPFMHCSRKGRAGVYGGRGPIRCQGRDGAVRGPGLPFPAAPGPRPPPR